MVQPTFDDGQKQTSERRAELARAIPSEEEEDEANRRQAESNVKLEYFRGAEEEGEAKPYKERCQRESERPQLLLLGKMQ